MFEKNRNNQEPDALDERIHGLRNGLRASARLKAAAIDGEPLRSPAVSTQTHVRRFTKAIAVYAVCALLLLGTAIVLPSLLNRKDPTPATLQGEMLSPGQLYEQLLSAPNVVYREVGTVYFKDGSVITSHVTEMTRRGDLFTTLNYGEGELQNVRYYDVGADEPCVYYNRNDLWVTGELQGDKAAWAYWCTTYMEVNWLEEEHYKKTDDGYVLTKEYTAEQMKIFKCEDLEGTLTQKDGVYTLRMVRHNEQYRKEMTDCILEIQISFGNAPEIVLPETTICTHEYEVEVIPSEHPCRYGDETRYTCKMCGVWYNEWSPTIPHNIVDGICTGCGMDEEAIGNLQSMESHHDE
jgi:hypothetical protein